MSRTQSLGDFEQVVLLAILRLRSAGAYGVSIGREIAEHTRRRPTPGAIYTTLDRLEGKGFLTSAAGEATPERGGRAKRYYEVTAEGQAALRQAQMDYRALLNGLDILGDAHA